VRWLARLLRRPRRIEVFSQMLEGMYTAAAGMAAQQSRLDAVANDLANASTTGYKHVRVAYRDLAYTQGTSGATTAVRVGSGAAATMIGRDNGQGAFQETGRNLDVAVEGLGYIQVRSGTQRSLTRDGNLQIDGQGRLAMQDGALLDPPVTLPRGSTEDQVDIGADGTVSVAGKVAGKITLVNVANPAGLDGGADNRFQATAASGAVSAAPRTTALRTGVLEGSNVDMGEAMTDMMDAQRSFELASKAIQMADQVQEIANGIKR
jgi:flagellar basal-body rod protein FlgG